MRLETEFVEISLDDLHREAALMKVEGWRFIETHAVNTDDGIDLYYAFMKDGLARNLKIVGVTKDKPVPSITDLFLAAFVFENEARELFGVDMRDIAIDFAGALYAPAEFEPMTIFTPEQKAAREKARKAQAAKAAKAASPESDAGEKTTAGGHVFVMTPERKQRLEAKMANMSPEKIAKVEAALKAREAEAAAAASGAAASSEEKAASKAPATTMQDEPAAAAAPGKTVDALLESKIALLDDAKAAKVRAVLFGQAATPAAEDESADAAPIFSDSLLEAKIAAMDADKAAKVRAALAAKAAREASTKGGE